MGQRVPLEDRQLLLHLAEHLRISLYRSLHRELDVYRLHVGMHYL